MIPDSPRSFGYKMGWLCVRAQTPDPVAQAVGVIDQRPCTWAEGVGGQRPPFVSPAVHGWVFVLWVIDAGDLAFGRSEAVRISRTLDTDACFFHSDRVVDAYAFVHACRGVEQRAFGTEDGTVHFDEGTPSPFEGMPPGALDGVDAFEAELLKEMSAGGPNEDTVQMVAGDWCIDPSELGGGSFTAPGLGLTGRLR